MRVCLYHFVLLILFDLRFCYLYLCHRNKINHSLFKNLGNAYIIQKTVLVSLAQLVRTMHNICKVWGSNLDHHKKKYNPKNLTIFSDYIIRTKGIFERKKNDA